MYRDYRRIENYPDYIVSNYGEVYSLKFGKVKEMKPRVGTNGYRHVHIGDKYPSVHVLVGNAFVGKRHGEMTFDHFPDRTKLNNRADNIRLATKSDQRVNTKLNKNSKTGERNILNYNEKGSDRTYWRIEIERNKKCVFKKLLNKKKFSIEDAIKLRDDFLLTWSTKN